MYCIINMSITILLIIYFIYIAEKCYCKDLKDMLQAIKNYTKNGNFKNKPKFVPIDYLPNFEGNPLEYPEKNYTKLKVIKEIWDNYYKCLNEQVHTYERGNTVPLMAKMAFEGTTLELDCGLCLSPKDSNLSPEWYYSRTYNINMADILTEKETNIVSEDDNNLYIFNIQQQDSGLYYCSFKGVSGPNYFVHIAYDSEPRITVRPDTAPSQEHQLADLNIQDLGIIIKTDWSDWTNCNRCGYTGKRMRFGTCIVATTITNETIAKQKKLLILYYFKDGIPCRSKLLPKHILNIEEVKHRPNQIMVSYCKIPCKKAKLFIEYNVEDKTEIVYNNTNGVYSINQLLPPIKPFAKRITIYAQQNAKQTLCCPGSWNTNTPVQWIIGHSPIYGPVIKRKTNGRITINEVNQIVFSKVKFSDMQMYSCLQDRELVGTIHLIIFKPPNTIIDKINTIVGGFLILATILIIFFRNIHYKK